MMTSTWLLLWFVTVVTAVNSVMFRGSRNLACVDPGPARTAGDSA